MLSTTLHLVNVTGYCGSCALVVAAFQSLIVSNSATPWSAACQASLSFTVTRSLLKPMSNESVMLSNDLNLCHPLLLLSSIFPSIRVCSNESVLCIRWPKYCIFSFSFSPCSEYSKYWFPLGWTDLISFLPKGLPSIFSKTTVQKHQFFGTQLSL